MAMKHYFVIVEDRVNEVYPWTRHTSFFFCEPGRLEVEIHKRYSVFEHRIISITAL